MSRFRSSNPRIRVGWEARDLPPHRQDPFDRILLAEAAIARMGDATGSRLSQAQSPILPA